MFVNDTLGTRIIFSPISQGEKDIGLFIKTSPQSLFLLVSNFGDFYWSLIGWLVKLIVQTFQPLIVIYWRGTYVYQHWECAPFYRLLNYPQPPWYQYSLMFIFHYKLMKKIDLDHEHRKNNGIAQKNRNISIYPLGKFKRGRKATTPPLIFNLSFKRNKKLGGNFVLWVIFL